MRISSGAVNLSQLHAVYNLAAARLIALDGMMHAFFMYLCFLDAYIYVYVYLLKIYMLCLLKNYIYVLY